MVASTTETEGRGNKISGMGRRSVARGAVWALPGVVVLGSALPMVASGTLPPQINISPTGSACKIPGCSNPDPVTGLCKQYVLFPCFVNTGTTPVTVTITGVYPVGQTWTLIPANSTLTFTVPADGVKHCTRVEVSSTNSSNASATITYSVSANGVVYPNLSGSTAFSSTGNCPKNSAVAGSAQSS